jgi:Putative motility protein
MDVSNIANLATTLANTGTAQAIAVTIQRKAMDIEASSASALLAALPPVEKPNLPPHLGQHIDTTA